MRGCQNGLVSRFTPGHNGGHGFAQLGKRGICALHGSNAGVGVNRGQVNRGVRLFGVLINLLVDEGGARTVRIGGVGVRSNHASHPLDSFELLDQIAANGFDLGIVQGANQCDGLVDTGMHGPQLLLHIGNRLEILHARCRADMLFVCLAAHQSHVDLA